jgi:integrase/recombinase XerD
MHLSARTSTDSRVPELVVGWNDRQRGIGSGRVDSLCKGSHLFRHTLATQMLRHGASLDEIGELLRHRSPETTAIYAKVDLASLRSLAVAWPGGDQ